MYFREKEEAGQEARNEEGKSSEEVNQTKAGSSATKTKVGDDDDDDDDDIADLYDLAHYDSDEDVEGNS